MATEVFATPTHSYEQEKCSGLFMYTVDDCTPAYIRFSARISLRVVLSKNKNFTSCTVEEGNRKELQISESDLHLGGSLKIFHKDSSFECVDTEDNGPGRNSGDEVDELIVNEALNSPKANLQKREEDSKDLCSSTKEIPQSEEADSIKEYEELELSESCPSKYNLRLRRKEQLHTDNQYTGDISSVDKPAKEEPPISFDRNKTTDTKKAKTLKGSVQKVVPKSESKVMKNKALKDGKRKRFTKERNNDGEHESTETETLSLDKERMNTRKQSKSKKLLMSQNLKCYYCDVPFFNKIDFFNHRRNKGSSFQCKICGKHEPFEAHLMAHMLSHEPDKGYVDNDGVRKENAVKRRRHKIKCNVCGLIVSSIDSLKVHMILHTGESPYRCCLCKDQAFFSLSSLRHHQEGHSISKRFQCKTCEMRFPSRTELSKHKLTHEIKCGLCGELFPNKTSRACHYRTSHANDIKRCTECLGLFSTDEELQKHILYHRKGKKEQCPVCGIVVTKLKDHMVTHTTVHGENLFACDQCPMKYTRKSSLNKHLLVHTGEKPYACSVCPKKFRSNGMLRKHLLTHTLERPFVCELCGKQFSLRSNLVTHMRIHSETRKYPCSYCLQAFNYKTSLEIHMKCKHSTADNPPSLSCAHCFQTFQEESTRKAHVCPSNTMTMAMKNSKETNTEWETLNLSERSFSHEQAQTSLQPTSLLQDYPLKDRQGKLLSGEGPELNTQRQDQPLPFTPNLHSSQEHSLASRQELPLTHRPYKPQAIITGQEPTYLRQESSMMPFLYSNFNSNSPRANQTNVPPTINPHVPIHGSSTHSGLNPLDSVANFPIPTSNCNININFGRGFTPSNNVDSQDFGRGGKSSSSSTISSILSAPPAFRCIPPALEQVPQSINFSNVPLSNCSKNPPETNNTS